MTEEWSVVVHLTKGVNEPAIYRAIDKVVTAYRGRLVEMPGTPENDSLIHLSDARAATAVAAELNALPGVIAYFKPPTQMP